MRISAYADHPHEPHGSATAWPTLIGVLVMEVDKVADMKIPIEDLTEVILDIGDWVKIPLEDFSGEILLIGDTYGDDVRGVDWGAGHGG